MKKGLYSLFLFFLVMPLVFGQVLVIQQPSSAIEQIGSRIELVLLDWFFEADILALNETNLGNGFSMELIKYMARRMNARSFVLWSIQDDGLFRLAIYNIYGQHLDGVEENLSLNNNGLEHRVSMMIEPSLRASMQQLGLLS